MLLNFLPIMTLSSIKENEEIIQVLEEIDENFSAIKTTLRELRLKIGKMAEKNKEIVEDCKPWIKFFDVHNNPEFSPFSDLHLASLKYKEISQSPNNLSSSTPKNPFVEIESSELLNRSIFKDLKASSSHNLSLESINITNEKENIPNNDSDETDHGLKPFEKSQLPEIFQNETDLDELYFFIQKNRSVSLEDITDHFKNISPEKLEILISILCRKRFVKIINSKITVDK